MRHSDIALAAISAARAANKWPVEGDSFSPYDPTLRALYDYARERKFPKPEVLARKWGEMTGQPFAHRSLAEAPEGQQAFFIAFRAIAEALEPMHDDDPDGYAAEIDGRHLTWIEKSSRQTAEEQSDKPAATPKKKRK